MTAAASAETSVIRQLAVPIAFLVTVPIAPILHYVFHAPPTAVFIAGVIAIAVLADWMRRATEHAADKLGPAIGGLLNISFGSLAELLLALFVLADGKVQVVRAQITGSIIGTSLLGLGLAIIVGGIGREKQVFKRERAGMLSSMLILVTIALLLPAVFDFAGRKLAGGRDLAITDEQLSLAAASVLLFLYVANLVYTLVTHRDVFSSKDQEEPSEAAWPLWVSLTAMAVLTAIIALEAELVSDALEATAGTLHLSSVFLGVIVLALVGTAADLFAAVVFARADRMGLVMSICIGSAIQISLVVAPLLVILSWAIGHPMTLVFENPIDLFAIAATAWIVNSIANDGETTWFEGVLLVGVYILFALAFFFSAPVGGG